MIIWISSLLILFISILYIADRNKYANEEIQLEKENIHLYDLKVETPLRFLVNYLGVQPVELVDWEEQQFLEDLSTTFNNIETGISNINNLEIGLIPKRIRELLHNLQEEVISLQENINKEKSLDQDTKEKIVNFSKSISLCKVEELNRSWEEIESELECLNELVR